MRVGRTGHHYNDGIAFKFEDDTYETVFRSIEWQTGRTDELMKDAAAAFGIVAVERFHHAPFVACPGMHACRLPAAGAGLWYHVLIVPAVQIFLYMGNDHVALGYQDAASGVQLQSFDEGQVMRHQGEPQQPAALPA